MRMSKSKGFFCSHEGHVQGYASVFHVKDLQKETIIPGAFKGALNLFNTPGEALKMLFEHDPDIEVGQWHRMEEDAHGLWVEGQLNLTNETGRRMLMLIEMKQVNGLSIGFIPLRTFQKDNIRIIENLKLIEISLVSNPANPLAAIGSNTL